MARDPNIPLFLWIATALLCHLLGGGGADRAARLIQERIDVQRFAESVRQHVRRSARPLEVALMVEEPGAEDPEESPPDEAAPESDEAPEQDVETELGRDERSRTDEKKAKPAEVEPDKKEEKEKKPEEKKKDEPKQDLPLVAAKNRIAVQQHVDDPNQKDNPEAEFIGDHANRVQQQTQARITATDQNDPTPNPGSTYHGPSSEPGNAYVNDIAHSEDAPGEVDQAPNEAQASGKKATDVSSEQQKGGGNPNSTSTNLEANKGTKKGVERGDEKSRRAQTERKAIAAQERIEAAPDALTSPRGRASVPKPRAAQDAQQAQAGRVKRLPPRKGQSGSMDFLGLGASGSTRGGINLNLTHGDAVAAVGRDQLARERVADGERRRSKHRGSWKALGIERWRASIENYNSSVKPGNQTALNTARVPFAGYLNQIHNRLHPIFADSFLGSLGGLPREHPLNRPDMKTNLEIVLDKEKGGVVKMGVTHSSGSTIFDIAALESVQSASPFGKPPNVIVSKDGNVYLHWEFYRNPYYACSTYFARPYMLNIEPKSEPPRVSPPTPSSPFGPREEPLPVEGYLLPPLTPARPVHAVR